MQISVVQKQFRNKFFLSIFLAALLLIFSLNGAVASSDGEHASKGWLPTDTYRVMNFAVLALALFFVLRKPVSQALSSRSDGIKKQLADLETRKEDVEKKLAEYNEKLSKLDSQAEEIVAQYIQQGHDAKDKILKEAGQAADKLEEQARKNIEYEFKQAKLKLQKEILEKSLLKAEEMIREKINDQDQGKLIDEYLDKVVA